MTLINSLFFMTGLFIVNSIVIDLLAFNHNLFGTIQIDFIHHLQIQRECDIFSFISQNKDTHTSVSVLTLINKVMHL